MRRVAALCGLALAATMGLWPAAASAEGPREGDVVIIDTSGGPITEGTTSTVFALQVPPGAACQGDSANGNYRIQTFLVPVADDPGALTYENGLKPVGEGRWSIWQADTNPGNDMFTTISGPGQPGLVADMPSYSFDVKLFPGEIASGEYRLGLACTLYNETTRYWDTSLTIAEGPSADDPIRWSTSGPGSATSSSSSPVLLLVGVVALSAVVVGVALVLNRNRSADDRRARSEEET